MLNLIKDTYLHLSLKIWNFTCAKTIASSIMACIVTYIGSFSENYLGLSGSLGMAMGTLLIVDFITGLLAASKNKDKITSRKGLRSLYKTGAYILFLYIAYNLRNEVEMGLFEDVTKYFHVYLIAHICFWELFSVDENLKKLGVDLGLSSTLTGIMTRIRGKITEDSDEEKEEETEEEIIED